MFLENKNSRIEEIQFSEIKLSGIRLFVKREDELHPIISGNKYRKLKYNLEEANRLNYNTLLTFGGAYSNHIAATAGAAKAFNFKSIGVIRGDELQNNLTQTLQLNPTLKFAHECGMKFYFVDRSSYRNKTNIDFIDNLKHKFGEFYLVPEGGTNKFAIKGCEEILNESDSQFDVITTAVGTGGTISGIINAAKKEQFVLGFPALKGDFLKKEIVKWVKPKNNWDLNLDYHFGGYAKISEELIIFINKFKEETQIPLDPIYTGKMFFGLVDLIKKGYFKLGTQILAIHTGGLQGIEGMNRLLSKKNLPLLV
ncbi:MAG: 1-aminocyclopropane-1-carboxylate deaminase/D-cysteine desulfhydrase [Lutibacter sp.]